MTYHYQVAQAVVRGDRPVEALTEVGVEITNTETGRRVVIPAGFTVRLPLADLAFGLLTSWVRGTELRHWASVMLMVSDIEFDDIDTDHGEALLDALGAAATGEEVPDAALDVARKLVG